MKAKSRRVQRTVEVCGKKVKMVASRHTMAANHCGWYVTLESPRVVMRVFCARLTADEAFAYALARLKEGAI